MPVYEYKGLNDKGKKVQGVREADSPKALKSLLRKDGIFPTDIYEEKGGKSKSGGDKKKLSGSKKESGGLLSKEIDFGKYFQRVKLQEVAMFTRQLATLNRAGITLVAALTALVDQTENEKFKRILSQVKDRVNEGSSFADALNDHPKIFSNLYINMVRAGESSGALDVVLERLADFTEKQMELRRKIVGAITYPIVMAMVGVLVVAVLMTVVVPKVTKLFEDIKATLPWNTRLLISISRFIGDWWFILFPLIGLGVYFLKRYIDTEAGREKYDTLVLKIPIFGKMARMVATTRFAGTMATLLASGVQMLAALDIVKSVVGNAVLSKVIEEARDNVREGESLAVPIRRSGEFEPLVGHMITIGEQSGQLEEMLEHVARSYESQTEARITQMTALLEPLILIVMAVVAGFVIMSILMPILQLNNSIR
jgi:general secretion pathway protein F